MSKERMTITTGQRDASDPNQIRLLLQQDPKLCYGCDENVHSEQSRSSETEIPYGLKVDHGDFSEIFTLLYDIRS